MYAVLLLRWPVLIWFLDMICELMPSPKEVEDEICTDLDGNPAEVVCADDQPLAAFVFKTIADPFCRENVLC